MSRTRTAYTHLYSFITMAISDILERLENEETRQEDKARLDAEKQALAKLEAEIDQLESEKILLVEEERFSEAQAVKEVCAYICDNASQESS